MITVVDRTSGFLLSSHTPKKTAWNICDGLRDMFNSPVDTSGYMIHSQIFLPREYKQSLTSDNGREFAYHTIVAYETGMSFYFAHPYAPWERGTNENTN